MGSSKREDVDALWDNPFYVPFYRQAEDGNTRGFVGGGTGGFTGKTAFKKLKGGTEKLTANLWQNAFGNWAHLIDASIRNKAANQVLETALEDGIVEKVTTKQYDHEMTKAQKEDVVWTMVDGEKTYWRVDDPFTLKAITALDYVQSSTPLMGIGRAAKRLLQTGVAASPIFQVRNLIRDTENAIAVSPIAKNVFRNLADGARQQDVANGLKNVARAICRSGTSAKLRSARRPPTLRPAAPRCATPPASTRSFRNADTYLDSETKIGKFWDYFRRIGQASTEAMGFGENMNRLALYRQLGEQGAPTELRAYEARDLSDFTLTGASPIIRHLVEVVPYMNAWMQGLYKVGRAAADADKERHLGRRRQGGRSDHEAAGRGDHGHGRPQPGAGCDLRRRRGLPEPQRVRPQQQLLVQGRQDRVSHSHGLRGRALSPAWRRSGSRRSTTRTCRRRARGRTRCRSWAPRWPSIRSRRP